MAKETEKVMEKTQETEANTEVEEAATEQPVETKATPVNAEPVLTKKEKFQIWAYNNRTRIVGVVAAITGMAAGAIVGGKIGFSAGKASVLPGLPDNGVPEAPAEIPTTADIPTDIEV